MKVKEDIKVEWCNKKSPAKLGQVRHGVYLPKTNSATVFVTGTCPELLILAASNIFVKLCVSSAPPLPAS